MSGHCSIPENHAPTTEQIHEFMTRLSEAPDGAKIVVFCHSGMGRTACMGAAYWIAQGLRASTAIERMIKRVWIPNGQRLSDVKFWKNTNEFDSAVQKIRFRRSSGGYGQQTKRAERPHGSIPLDYSPSRILL